MHPFTSANRKKGAFVWVLLFISDADHLHYLVGSLLLGAPHVQMADLSH